MVSLDISVLIKFGCVAGRVYEQILLGAGSGKLKILPDQKFVNLNLINKIS